MGCKILLKGALLSWYLVAKVDFFLLNFQTLNLSDTFYFQVQQGFEFTDFKYFLKIVLRNFSQQAKDICHTNPDVYQCDCVCVVCARLSYLSCAFCNPGQ